MSGFSFINSVEELGLEPEVEEKDETKLPEPVEDEDDEPSDLPDEGEDTDGKEGKKDVEPEPKDDEEDLPEGFEEYASLLDDLEEAGLSLGDDELEPTVDAVKKVVTGSVKKLAERVKELEIQLASKGTEDVVEGFDVDSVDMDDDEQVEAMIMEYYKERGLDEDEIRETLDTKIAKGKFDAEAEKAKNFLTKLNENRAKETQERQEREAALRAKEEEIQVSKLREEIIKMDSVSGLELGKEDREGFADFITKRDKKGQTEFMKKANNRDAQLLTAYLLYKGINADTLKVKAETKATKEVKKNLSRFKRPTKGKTITKEENHDIKNIRWGL